MASNPVRSIGHVLGQIYRIKWLRVTFPFLVLFLFWQGSVKWVNLPSYFYPSPGDVFRQFIEISRNGVLLAYLQDSLARYATGCFFGISLGIPLGVILAVSHRISRMLNPLVNFFQAIVELAWLPLFVIWFGYSFTTIILSLSYVVAFPVMFNVMIGIRRVPRTTIDGMRVLGAKWYHIVFEVLIPGALPDMVTGIRVGAGYAFRGLVGAEMIAAHNGLGYMLFEARKQGFTGRIIVGMIMLGALWLFIDRVYLKAIERATIERWGVIRNAEGN